MVLRALSILQSLLIIAIFIGIPCGRARCYNPAGLGLRCPRLSSSACLDTLYVKGRNCTPIRQKPCFIVLNNKKPSSCTLKHGCAMAAIGSISGRWSGNEPALFRVCPSRVCPRERRNVIKWRRVKLGNNFTRALRFGKLLQFGQNASEIIP